VKIRAETEADQAAIRKINEEAFGETVEADLVETLRKSEHFVPELSLVADVDHDLVGHVLLTHVTIETGSHRVLQLGPLAVLPSHQRRGIGSALMKEALRLAEVRKEPLVMVEGNPAYYGRFGFQESTEIGIEPPPGVTGKYFMVRVLGAYDPALRGQAIYSEPFRALS
jgi:putative acetyltransferase